MCMTLKTPLMVLSVFRSKLALFELHIYSPSVCFLHPLEGVQQFVQCHVWVQAIQTTYSRMFGLSRNVTSDL